MSEYTNISNAIAIRKILDLISRTPKCFDKNNEKLEDCILLLLEGDIIVNIERSKIRYNDKIKEDYANCNFDLSISQELNSDNIEDCTIQVKLMDKENFGKLVCKIVFYFKELESIIINGKEKVICHTKNNKFLDKLTCINIYMPQTEAREYFHRSRIELITNSNDGLMLYDSLYRHYLKNCEYLIKDESDAKFCDLMIQKDKDDDIFNCILVTLKQCGDMYTMSNEEVNMLKEYIENHKP